MYKGKLLIGKAQGKLEARGMIAVHVTSYLEQYTHLITSDRCCPHIYKSSTGHVIFVMEQVKRNVQGEAKVDVYLARLVFK